MENSIKTRLKMARKAAGLSLRKTGKLVNLSHAAIKKYEDGEAYPSSDILLRLAKAYDVRTEYFFRTVLFKIGEIKFRKRQKLQKKILESIKQEITDQMERRFELERLLPSFCISHFKIPKSLNSSIQNLDQIEEICNEIRQIWKLGITPIVSLSTVLESHGVKVFSLQQDNQNFDGLSAVADKIPLIVVSSRGSVDRQRFTLAHEFGHFILDERLSSQIDEEEACNRFAGAFLLPQEVLFQEIGKTRKCIHMRELLLLKEQYGISMAAICHRLKDLGIIKESYFKNLMSTFQENGWNIQEPGILIFSEKLQVFEHLVFHALAEGIIGDSKAAELLNLPLEEFRTLKELISK